MKEDYIRQHYVWRYYLKPWSKNNLIFCLRKDRIFQSSLIKIAQEKYFYKTEELNKAEIDLIMKMIKSFPKENHSLLVDTFHVYLATSNGPEYLQKNGIEIFHGIVERRAQKALDNLILGDMSILNDEETKIDFCKFVARQYSRTKKIKTRISSTSNDIPLPDDYVGKCEVSKIMKVFSFLSSESIGNWIYSESKITLLENTTNIKFITSDQPVFNLKSKENEVPNEMELFYPITPDKALLFSTRDDIDNKINESEIIEFNNEIVNQSHEIIFSKNRNEIEQFT